MPSTFFGLNIGASALFTYKVATNTTTNNIANVQTKGYTRQTASIRTTEALRVAAKYGSCGTGVEATEITQERDKYYDDKYWTNNSKVGFYEQSLYYLDQFQTVFEDDDIQAGFTTVLSSMFNALDSLKNDANDYSVRNQFINQSQKLCTYFNMTSQSLSDIQDDCNQEIKSAVNELNSIGKKISLLNREINAIEMNGGHANELRDERANLLDELSSYVSIETIEHEIVNTYGDNLGGTNFTVLVNGQVLVDGNDSFALKCVERDFRHNESDIDGLYDIVWEDTGMRFAAASESSNGSLKALFQIRDGNAALNMKGAITAVESGTNSTISIKPDEPDPNRLDIPKEGEILINNKYYHYDGWTAQVETVDGKGQLSEIKFNLVAGDELTETQAEVLRNTTSKLVCGSTVDFMGVPYYQEQMNDFIREFTRQFNDIERGGTTLDGEEMGAFFTGEYATGVTYEGTDWQKDADGNYPTEITSEDDTYYHITASNVRVNLRSLREPNYFATSVKPLQDGTAAHDLVDQMIPIHSDVKFFRGTSGNKFLEVMISDITVDTQKKSIFYDNYSNLNDTIDTMRMSISGVDEDEEALNLMKFQNAYNLASKVISVMSEMYNKLINETGVA